MSYTGEAIYLTWGGYAAAPGVEIWQSGVKLALPGAPTETLHLPSADDLTTLLTEVIEVFHTSSGFYTSVGAKLVFAKAAHLDDQGHYITDPVEVEITPVGGYVTGNPQSGPQDATVVTLWSGRTLGRANFGRFYTPWAAGAITVGSGRCDATQVANQADVAATFIDGINAWAVHPTLHETLDPVVSIMSKVGTGETNEAVYVRVGDVRDTQRRRRDRIDEAYQQRALA